MRVMIDSNILDCLDKDTEALDELINRPDILLMVTPAQEQEVAAISDPAKRGRLEDILSRLCRHLAVPSPSLSAQVPKSSVPSVDSADDKIIATAKATGCNLLVSQDLEVLNKAMVMGIRAMTWKIFLSRVVWASKGRHK